MLDAYYKNAKITKSEDLQTKVRFTLEVNGYEKPLTLTFSDLSLANILKVNSDLPRNQFIAEISQKFADPSDKIPIVDFSYPLPQEWNQSIHILIENLASSKKLGVVDVNYIKAFDMPLYEYYFTLALDSYTRKNKLPPLPGVTRILNDTSILLQDGE
jgi:hypothetical protein